MNPTAKAKTFGLTAVSTKMVGRAAVSAITTTPARKRKLVKTSSPFAADVSPERLIVLAL
jgi:hypothetical protein